MSEEKIKASEEKIKARTTVIAALNKTYGKGSVGIYGEMTPMEVDVISTGSLSIDDALGCGGYARGRIVEIYGPEACIDGDTHIQYAVHVNGQRVNHKGGTIRRLWERFHGEPSSGDGHGKHLRPSSVRAFFTAPAVNEEDRIFHNHIKDVVRVGDRECWKLTTLSGVEITATADHKFYTGLGYKLLGDLEPGEAVFIHNNTRFTVVDTEQENERTHRKYVYVKNHPVAGVKAVSAIISRKNPGLKKDYQYHRLLKSRATVEAHMNGLTLSAYLDKLNSLDAYTQASLVFLRRDDHVHHLDENCLNDSIDNLVVISSSEHSKLHALERHNNLRFTAVADLVSSIEYVGTREVFDLKMEAPFNNYVAGGFVTHNSGKTTLTLHAIAEAQKQGGLCAFIDAEHALDTKYAANLGVNMDDVTLSQPNTGEEALEIAETLVRSGAFDLVVIDSVAALVPKAEIEGDMGDSHMGLQARLMSQACRKLSGTVSQTKTTLIFINQIRMKIGVMFGSPETTTGGNALKFYASQRLDIRRIGTIKKGEVAIGNRVRVKIAKNKLAAPFKQCEFDIIFGKGVHRTAEVLDAAVLLNIVEKSGAWYSMDTERLGQGRDNTIDTLNSPEWKDKFDLMEREVLKQLGILKDD